MVYAFLRKLSPNGNQRRRANSAGLPSGLRGWGSRSPLADFVLGQKDRQGIWGFPAGSGQSGCALGLDRIRLNLNRSDMHSFFPAVCLSFQTDGGRTEYRILSFCLLLEVIFLRTESDAMKDENNRQVDDSHDTHQDISHIPCKVHLCNCTEEDDKGADNPEAHSVRSSSPFP